MAWTLGSKQSGSRREHQTSRRSIPSSFAGALGFFGRMVDWFNGLTLNLNSKKLKISSEYQLILYLHVYIYSIIIYICIFHMFSRTIANLQLMSAVHPCTTFYRSMALQTLDQINGHFRIFNVGCSPIMLLFFFVGDFDIRFGPGPTWSGEDQQLVFFGKMI